jgi:GTP-binding protein HflX
MVFNKIDAFSWVARDEYDLTPAGRDNHSLEDLKRTWMAKGEKHPVIFISAKYEENIQELKKILYREVKKIHITRYPYNDFLFELPSGG